MKMHRIELAHSRIWGRDCVCRAVDAVRCTSSSSLISQSICICTLKRDLVIPFAR